MADNKDIETIIRAVKLQRDGELILADKIFSNLYNNGCRDINVIWRLGLLQWQLWKDFDSAYRLLIAAIGQDPAFDPPKKVLYDIIQEARAHVDEHSIVLGQLRADGCRPDWMVDLGAHKGSWTKKAALHFPDARYLLIEADATLEAPLRAAISPLPIHADFAFAVIAEQTESARDFYLNGLGSSVYVENDEIFDYARKVSLPTLTLDDLFRSHGVNGATFLKIDVQGAEMEVLRGAGNMLDQVVGVLCEVNITQTYEGAPPADVVTGFLAERGFRLYDVLEPKRNADRRLTQIDMLYVRPAAVPAAFSPPKDVSLP